MPTLVSVQKATATDHDPLVSYHSVHPKLRALLFLVEFRLQVSLELTITKMIMLRPY